MVVIVYVARFIYLVKIKNSRIRFAFINKRIFSIFGDNSSNFNFYIKEKFIKTKRP